MKAIKKILRFFYREAAKFLGSFKNELTVNFDKKKLKFSTRSKVAKEWFYPRYISGWRMHEPPVAGLVAEKLKQKDIFFDIGANLGFFSILASYYCNQGGEVHTFEMDPQLIPLIEESVNLNKNVSQVIINSFACSNINAELCQFSADQVGNPSTNSLNKNKIVPDKNKQVTNVLSLSIDKYCEQVDVYPDFMKIDIEGAEVFALPGMLETLDKSKPEMILELHPEVISQFGSSIKEVIEPIFDLNYEAYMIKSYRNTIDDRQLKNRLTSFDLENIDGSKPNVLFLTQ